MGSSPIAVDFIFGDLTDPIGEIVGGGTSFSYRERKRSLIFIEHIIRSGAEQNGYRNKSNTHGVIPLIALVSFEYTCMIKSRIMLLVDALSCMVAGEQPASHSV